MSAPLAYLLLALSVATIVGSAMLLPRCPGDARTLRVGNLLVSGCEARSR